MIIKDNRAPLNKFEFNDLGIGSVFTIDGDSSIYMKLPDLVDEDKEERINAIDLQTNETEEMSYCELCMPIQATLCIDYFNV